MLKLSFNIEVLEYVDNIINTVREPIITLDDNLRVVSVNRSFYSFFNAKPENTIGHLIFEMDNKQWDTPILRELLETILPHKTSVDDYVVVHNFVGIGLRIMLLNARKMEQSKVKASVIFLAMEDITERANDLVIADNGKENLLHKLIIANNKLAFQNEEKDKQLGELIIARQEFAFQNEEKELLVRNLKRAASVFTHAHESIMITDANATITEVNDSFSRITGYNREDVLGEKRKILQSGRHSAAFIAEIRSTLLTQGFWRGEIWNRRKNGEIYPEINTISAVKNDAGLVQHYVSLSTDITSIKAHQKQLEHIAHYDVLTNLPNRVLLADRLNQAMVQCQRKNWTLAVAFMDLDGFKKVNDIHGHNVGDQLLVAVSQRMQNALRAVDTLARIGGDEFIAVLGDLQNIEDSTPILERLLKTAADPVTLGGNIMQVTASIGVAFYPQDGEDADQLIRHADQAMYVAKQTGKNRYRLFDTALANTVKIQLQRITDITLALKQREFVLHYQPKVNMRTGAVIGVEALIRWQHPVRGLVPPLEFLPVIEGHAISLDIGEWVITNALSQISQWQGMGVYLPVSVNISAYQLQQNNFTARLTLLLAAYPQVSPQSLELEILETSALHDVNRVSTTMKACHELGVRFALDDFGTGYSSLNNLRRLPAHMIKIDQTFVRDMLENVEDCAIVKGVTGLAQAFQREVIAEGVETIAHGIALLQLGCELAQGYSIARPMSARDIPEWLSNWEVDDLWLAQVLIKADLLDR